MFNPTSIIETVGLLGVFIIVFCESGIFFGFFLPGDTLLFTAGIFAAGGYFSLPLLIAGSIVACILGDNVGYLTGKKMGRGLFEKDASFFFNKKRVYDAEHFYQRHGAVTIIVARFIPVVRTFAPIVAGVAQMHYRTFFVFNIIGGVLWATLIPLVGYYFGGLIPNIETYIFPILLVVLAISFLPFLLKLAHHIWIRNR